MMMLWLIAATMTAMPVKPVPVETPCPEATVCAWNKASIVRGLQAAGYRAAITADDQGEPYVASATNGDDFSVSLSSCDDDVAKTGCKTLVIGSWYSAKPYLTQALANRFNKKDLYGRAFISDKGTLDLDVVVAGDGGIPQAQWKAWLSWYGLAEADLAKLVEEATAARDAAVKPK